MADLGLNTTPLAECTYNESDPPDRGRPRFRDVLLLFLVGIFFLLLTSQVSLQEDRSLRKKITLKLHHSIRMYSYVKTCLAVFFFFLENERPSYHRLAKGVCP